MAQSAVLEFGRVKVGGEPLRSAIVVPRTPPGRGQGVGGGRGSGHGKGQGIGLTGTLSALVVVSSVSAPVPQPPPDVISGVVAYGTQSSTVSTAGTSYAAGADVLSSAISFTADGVSSYGVFINGPGQSNTTAGTNSNDLAVTLDGAQSVFMGLCTVVHGTGAPTMPVSGVGVLAAPSAGSHTVNVRLWTDGSTAKLYATPDISNSKIVVYVLKLG